MRQSYAPSVSDLIFVVVAPLTAIRGAIKLTQADGDLSAHVRMGNVILATRHIPTHSLASYTAATEPMLGHAWLAEIFYASLYNLGGLPLVCVFAGIVVGATHGAIALFLRRHGADPRWAFLAALLSLALASTHWLARPHLFSIVGATLTLFLLESERPRRQLYFIPLYAVWANLHGGWLYGLAVIAMYIAGEMGEAWLAQDERKYWLDRARRDMTAFVLAAVSTIVNPFGFRIYREVLFAATSSSLAKNMAEFLPPNFQDAGQWPFLLALLAMVALLSFGTRRIQLNWLAVIMMSLFFALRSFRNIALFGVTAWPLVALHVARSFPKARRPFRWFTEVARIDPQTRTGLYALPVAALMLLVGLNRGSVGGVHVIEDHFDKKTFPVVAVDSAKRAHLDGRIFNAWVWGGYLMLTWPEAKLHVDPLKFSDTTMKTYTTIENVHPDWLDELAKWKVQTIIYNANTPLAKALATAPGWTRFYEDSLAVVYRATNAR
ncbi:MAG TPA: hypothetical protein VM099_00610 [Gemmatimonadaceae bacterium]|nr:hypothetical protein [Gemmatimonadaceae bacterium]